MTAISGRPKPEICPLTGQFWGNTLAQGVLRQFTQWPWIEHPTSSNWQADALPLR